MTERNYWIGVVSKNHVDIAIAGGFTQVNHGKAGAARAHARGDGFAFYSPRTDYPDGDAAAGVHRASAASATASSTRPTPATDFQPVPSRRRLPARHAAPIRPLIDALTFIRSKDALGRGVPLRHRARAGRGFRAHRRGDGTRFRRRLRAVTTDVSRPRSTPAARCAMLRAMSTSPRVPRRPLADRVAVGAPARARGRRPLRRAGRAPARVRGRAALRVPRCRRARRLRVASARLADARRASRGLAAYLRVVDPGRKFAEPSIGRVLTAADYRRIGLGRVLMIEGLARTAGVYPGHADPHRRAVAARGVLREPRLSHRLAPSSRRTASRTSRCCIAAHDLHASAREPNRRASSGDAASRRSGPRGTHDAGVRVAAPLALRLRYDGHLTSRRARSRRP